MPNEKCEDCHSSETISQKLMRELTPAKLLTAFSISISVVFSAGFGTSKLYDRFSDTEAQSNKNKSINDSILTVVSGISQDFKIIKLHIRKLDPEFNNLCKITEDKRIITVSDNTIIEEEEKRKRSCVSLTTTEKDFKN